MIKVGTVFLYMLAILYGTSLLSIFVHNRGRKNGEKIEDFGIKLMKEIDTNDKYLLNEFIDYRLDEVFVIFSTLYGLTLNFLFNKNKKWKFMFEWFMLLSILFAIKTIGMMATIYPTPNTETCRVDYKNEEGIDVLFNAIKVYIYRDRVCYDIFMNNDLMNTTVIMLLLLKHFEHWTVKLKGLVIWLCNIFVLMMMRGVYTSNLFVTLLVSFLVYMMHYYEEKLGRGGLFGSLLVFKYNETEHNELGSEMDDIEMEEEKSEEEKSVEEKKEEDDLENHINDKVELEIIDEDLR